MEEPVLGGQFVNGAHGVWCQGFAPFEGPQAAVGDGLGCARVLGPDKRGAPGVRDKPLALQGGVGVQCLEPLRPGMDVGQGGRASAADQLTQLAGQPDVQQGAGITEQVVLPREFVIILLLQGGGDLLVVALQRYKRLVRHPLCEQGRGGPDKRVADLDLGVQEGERTPWVEGFQPQRYLRQLRGERVQVYAIDTAPHYVTQRFADALRWRLRVAGADRGDPLGDPAGGGDEEVAGATGGVADGEREQRRLGVGLAFGAVEHGVECGVEQAVDERGGRVVGTGRLAVVAGRRQQFVDAHLGIPGGHELQQRLVDRAEFFGTEIAVIHDPLGPSSGFSHQAEVAHRLEQGLVGELAVAEQVERAGFEESPDADQAELGASVDRAEPVPDEVEGAPLVGVAGAAATSGGTAQPGRGEVVAVAFAGLDVGVRVEEQAAVLGHEGEEQPVDDPEQAVVDVGLAQGAVCETVTEASVGRVGEEAGAEGSDRLDHPVAQLVERPRPGLDRLGSPALEPAGGGALLGVAHLEPGLVADAVEQQEVGEQVAVEDRLEIELDIGGPDQ